MIQGVLPTDQQRSHEARVGVLDGVGGWIVQVGQARGVTLWWTSILRHPPFVGEGFTWLDVGSWLQVACREKVEVHQDYRKALSSWQRELGGSQAQQLISVEIPWFGQLYHGNISPESYAIGTTKPIPCRASLAAPLRHLLTLRWIIWIQSHKTCRAHPGA